MMNTKHGCDQDEYFLLNLFQSQGFQYMSFPPECLNIFELAVNFMGYCLFDCLLFCFTLLCFCVAKILSCHIFLLDVLLLIVFITTILPMIMMVLVTHDDE